MPKNQYNAPAMEVVEFGKEDNVCTFSRYDVFDHNGNLIGGGDIGHWPEGGLPWGDD